MFSSSRSDDHQVDTQMIKLKLSISSSDQQNDNKLLSRVVSKESSMANLSSRSSVLYYGGRPGSVPFLWESQPGTPKSKFSEHSDHLIPPLTPPPSYYSNSHKKTFHKVRSPRSNLLNTLFPKKMITLKKTQMSFSPYTTSSSSPPSPSFWSYSSSETTSSTFVPINASTTPFHGRFPSSSSSFDSRGEVVEEDQLNGIRTAGNSPTSTLCFGLGRAIRRGCHRF